MFKILPELGEALDNLIANRHFWQASRPSEARSSSPRAGLLEYSLAAPEAACCLSEALGRRVSGPPRSSWRGPGGTRLGTCRSGQGACCAAAAAKRAASSPAAQGQLLVQLAARCRCFLCAIAELLVSLFLVVAGPAADGAGIEPRRPAARRSGETRGSCLPACHALPCVLASPLPACLPDFKP